MKKNPDVQTELFLEAMQKILHHIDEGVHIIDPQGKTILYNPAMEKIEGLSADEVMGKPLLEVFPGLGSKDSTLLNALANAATIEQQKQSYLNCRNERITTRNTSFPVFSDDKLLGAVEIANNYTEVNELTEKIVDLQQELLKPPKPRKAAPVSCTFDMLVGRHPEFRSVIEIAKRAAGTDASVLIYGETGTGKELIAQSIHNASGKRSGAMVAVNCGAMPDSLLESILFGTSKGSYTGALDRPGLFEQAHKGTLFLDEINSMSLSLQVKLLRALQDNRVRRLGGLEDLEVDVRIIAASNQPLEPLMDECLFRRDLYYRLNVINLRVPPLRERTEDIPLLANYFFKIFNEKMGRDVWLLSPELEDIFLRYRWPGNIRELQNIIESAMVMVKDEHVLEKKYLPDHFNRHNSREPDRAEIPENGLAAYLCRQEEVLIKKALEEYGGNISKAASLLQVSRQSLQYKIKRYRINT